MLANLQTYFEIDWGLRDRRTRSAWRLVSIAVLLLVAEFSTALKGSAQEVPAALHGPYNATFLADGPGLTKRMEAPGEAALFKGGSRWTMAFWFHLSGSDIGGRILIAGLGDPDAEDARFIGVGEGQVGLWLGKSPGKMVAAGTASGSGDWHFAAAVGDGGRITLYVDGKAAGSTVLAQGIVAPRLEMGPDSGTGNGRHFGGQIAGLNLWAEALTAEQVGKVAATPPDFKLPTYEEASKHWAVQTRSMAGQLEPQDPATLPRGKGGIEKPVAKTLSAADLRTELEGGNPWRIEGGWKLAAAPDVHARGEQISKAGFAANEWLAATVPGTVLTTMIDRGVYPDPDYGLNNMAIPESLAHQDYWYRVEFKTPAAARGQRLKLTFEGVNYAAEVWLNGKNLGGFTGAFVRGKFDVTNDVTGAGMNALAVKVSPPPHPGIAHEQSIKAGPGENGGIQVLDGPTFSADGRMGLDTGDPRPQHGDLAGRYADGNGCGGDGRSAGSDDAAQAGSQRGGGRNRSAAHEYIGHRG